MIKVPDTSGYTHAVKMYLKVGYKWRIFVLLGLIYGFEANGM